MASPSSPEKRAELFGRVYAAAQRKIRPLIEALIQTLDALGCGAGADFGKFESGVREVLSGFAHGPASAPQFTTLRIAPTPAARQDLIQGFLYRLGMDEDAARNAAQRVMQMPPENVTATGPGRVGITRMASPARDRQALFFDLRRLFSSGRDLHERLVDIRKEVSEPYRGRASDYRGHPWGRPSASTFADRGVEQTVDLLKMFPDLADGIYAEAGLRGVKGFPPVSAGGPLTGDDAEFVNHVDEFLDSEARWGLISAVGLIAAGVLLTVVTAGMAGPLVGMAVGAGIGVAQGGAQVINANNNLTLARDAHRAGAGSEARIAFLEGEVQGAWGMLLADVVTGGLLGRVGGAGNVSRVAQAFKTMAISGAGAGVGTATNPNVWDSPDVAAILIKATVIGGAAGGAGGLAGAALTRAGNRIMLGFSRGGGELKVGARVELAEQGGAPSHYFTGEVVAVEGNRVTISTPHGRATYSIDDVAVVKTVDGSPAPRATPDPEARTAQRVVEPRAPRVEGQDDFGSIADLEAPLLRDVEALKGMGHNSLMSMSHDLMPQVATRLEGMGYRTKLVPVTNQDGTSHMAVELLEAPGRLGTLMRRAGPAMDSDIRYIYDPIGLRRDGGSGLFDADLNAVRIGHGMMSHGHRGVIAPFLHELRHGRTALRLGDANYPYHGTFYFDPKSEMGSVSAAYRDQFQVDEMYAYLKQAGSSALEARRANAAVERDGLVALDDPRVKTFFGQRHSENEALTARGFARAVRTQAGEFMDALRNNATRVTTRDVTDGDFPSTIHRFKDENGRDVLHVEYWRDGQGRQNAILMRDTFDSSGRPVEDGQVALHFFLNDAPPNYTGDATHSLITRRMQGMIAASDDVIARALVAQDNAGASREAAQTIYQRAN